VVFSDYGVTKGRIHLAPVDGTPARRAGGGREGFEEGGKLSSDGRWIAYVSTKTGRMEVCVRAWTVAEEGWQLSANGGAASAGACDGREIFFVTGERLVRVSIEVRGDDLTVGPAQALSRYPPSPTAIAFRDYDYDHRGDRFLFTRRLGPSRSRARSRSLWLGGEAEGAGEVRGAAVVEDRCYAMAFTPRSRSEKRSSSSCSTPTPPYRRPAASEPGRRHDGRPHSRENRRCARSDPRQHHPGGRFPPPDALNRSPESSCVTEHRSSWSARAAPLRRSRGPGVERLRRIGRHRYLEAPR
jgi:hypothetical protein